MPQALPLAGIRVVDYTHFLAGPHCGRNLAALGAEVIKVERPKSGDAGRQHAPIVDGQSGYFLQQTMDRQRREAQKKQAAADTEIAALKDRIAKLEQDIVSLRKAAAPAAKDGAAPKK